MDRITKFIKENPLKTLAASILGVCFATFGNAIMQYVGYKFNRLAIKYIGKFKPKRIIFVRHGESEANVNPKIYNQKADWQVELSPKGQSQAIKAGENLKAMLSKDDTIECYISPYTRTRQTFEGVRKAINDKIILIREDPRLREQEFGSYTDEEMVKIRKDRHSFGRFYYRFPKGEAGSDVYDRASQMLDVFMRQINDIEVDNGTTYLVVTHSLFMKFFLTRYFHWPIEKFEQIKSCSNADFWILELNNEGRYELISKLEEDKDSKEL